MDWSTPCSVQRTVDRHRSKRTWHIGYRINVRADRLAGQLGDAARAADLAEQFEERTVAELAVRDRALLHLLVADECRLREHRAQHELREDLLHHRHAHRLCASHY